MALVSTEFESVSFQNDTKRQELQLEARFTPQFQFLLTSNLIFPDTPYPEQEGDRFDQFSQGSGRSCGLERVASRTVRSRPENNESGRRRK